MSNRIRKILPILATAAFLVTAPIVVFRTLGYRLNLKKGTVGETAVFIIDSVPQGAAVFLDGQATNQVTPARIRGLQPKQYEVRLEAPGYRPWHKTLEAQSSGVTFAEDIVLFPEREPVRIIEAPVSSARLSPNGAWMAYVVPGAQDEIWVRNQESGELSRLYRFPTEAGVAIEWSPRGDRFMAERDVARGVEAVVFVLPPGSPTLPLGEITDSIPSSVHWSADVPTEIEAVVGNSLLRIDPVARRGVELARVDGPEARVVGGVVYEVRPTLTAAALAARAIGETGQSREIIELPSLAYRLEESRSSWLPLASREDGKILVIQTAAASLEPLSVSAADLAWSPGKKQRELLLWNPFELWIADPLAGAVTLVTRLGVGLDDAAWSSNGTNLYVASQGTLQALERDDRGGRNTFTLAQFSSIRDIMPSPDAKYLYFVAETDSESGVYELDLR